MPHILFLLSAFLIGLGLCAQEPACLWALSAGGVHDDVGRDIATDAEGNAFIIGYFTSDSLSLGDTTLYNTNSGGVGHDTYFAKYDPAGNLVWARTVGGTGYTLAVDTQGDVLIAGVYFDSLTIGTNTFYSTGVADDFLAKYSADGEFLWATSLGGTLGDIPEALATTAAGEVLLCGTFASPELSFASSSTVLENGNPGTTNSYLARYDSSGNLISACSYGGDGYDHVHDVAADAAGHAVVTGFFDGEDMRLGTTVLDNAGTETADLFVAKYDDDGEPLWAFRAGGPDKEIAWALAVDGNDDILVGGQFRGATFTVGGTLLTNTTSNNEEFDVFLAKYHGNGTPAWARSGGGNLTELSNSVAVDPANNVVLAGQSESNYGDFDGVGYQTNGDLDLFAVKFTSDGQPLWALGAGGTEDDLGHSVAMDPSANVLLLGTFFSPQVQLGSCTLTNGTTNWADMMLLKLDGIATGLAEPPPVDGLTLYPVPSSGRVTLTSTEPMRQLVVRDATGRTVYRAKPRSQQAELELRLPGVYMAEISLGTATLTKRLVICE